jgi:hypothetical protein
MPFQPCQLVTRQGLNEFQVVIPGAPIRVRREKDVCTYIQFIITFADMTTERPLLTGRMSRALTRIANKHD